MPVGPVLLWPDLLARVELFQEFISKNEVPGIPGPGEIKYQSAIRALHAIADDMIKTLTGITTQEGALKQLSFHKNGPGQQLEHVTFGYGELLYLDLGNFMHPVRLSEEEENVLFKDINVQLVPGGQTMKIGTARRVLAAEIDRVVKILAGVIQDDGDDVEMNMEGGRRRRSQRKSHRRQRKSHRRQRKSHRRQRKSHRRQRKSHTKN